MTDDLRNPLSVLQISAELLEAHAYTDEVREELSHLRSALSQMQRMVDDLFAPSSSALRHRRLASDLTHGATEMLGRLATRNHLRLVDLGSPEHVWVTVDEASIMRLFSNLIGNAIKFSPDGAAIYIGARVVGASVRFQVRDSGTGMTPEQLRRVFERSWQANPDDHRGRGLGLDIAMQVVVAHGGRLWAESTPGEGSTFLFELPVASDETSSI